MTVPTDSNQIEKLYIDTNILIHWSSTRQNRYFSRRATRLLDAIERGQYVGIISSLTLMEFYIVIKRLILRESQVQEHGNIEKNAREKLATVFRLHNTIFPKDTTVDRVLLFQVLATAFTILMDHPGKIVLRWAHYRFNSLGVADVIHLLTAKALGCTCIATFDVGFRDTSNILPVMLVHRDRIA